MVAKKAPEKVEAEVPVAPPVEGPTETPERPGREFISFGENEEAVINVTPRWERNIGRFLSVLAVGVLNPPAALVMGVVATVQALGDNDENYPPKPKTEAASK